MAKYTFTDFRRDQDDLLSKARLNIAYGALSNEKHPSSFIEGVTPNHIEYGRGAKLHFKSMDWIDYYGALGTNMFGYANPIINQAVKEEIDRGVNLSLSTTLEVQCAEIAKSIWPELERMRFFKRSWDAADASLTVAQAYTGKSLVLSNESGAFNEFSSIESILPHVLEQVAAIIVEPVIFDVSEARRKYLEELRAFTTKHGIILIFNETGTTFRVPKLSISNMWGIKPDLTCFGRAIANGFPLAIMGGRQDIMEHADSYIPTEFAGETASLAAFKATALLLLDHKNTDTQKIDGLWEHAKLFWAEINEITAGHVEFRGYPTHGELISGSDEFMHIFMQETSKAGVLFGRKYVYTFAHKEHDANTKAVVRGVIQGLKMNLFKREGKPPKQTKGIN